MQTPLRRAWVGRLGAALRGGGAAAAVRRAVRARLERVWQRQEPDWSILDQLRLSRTLLGLFAGGALALAGSLFQSMLRDALATPYTLGVSTGASLGAVVAICARLAQVGRRRRRSGSGALAGAGLILVRRDGRRDAASGSCRRPACCSPASPINSVCSALILLVHGLTGMSQSFAISRWLIGSLDAIERPTLLAYVLVVIGTRGWSSSARAASGTCWPSARRGRRRAARRVRRALFQRVCRRVGAGGGDRRADRPDRVRRPGRAAPASRRASAATTAC